MSAQGRGKTQAQGDARGRGRARAQGDAQPRGGALGAEKAQPQEDMQQQGSAQAQGMAGEGGVGAAGRADAAGLGAGAAAGSDGAPGFGGVPKQVVIATNNAHKLEEIGRILAPCGWEFHTLGEYGDFPEPVEDADSFEGNARIKAQAALAATGVAAIADDSGLQVDVLDGRPGVWSSRYAGPDASDADNNAKLLSELTGVPQGERTARFASTIVFIDTDGSELVARGSCEGRIADAPRGGNGFGYDPLFAPDALDGRTMAEASPAEKDAISHRGAALADFLRQALM